MASINYRYSTQAPYPAPFHDSARALQFLRLHAKKYNLNPKAVAATGGSAGGDISLWLGFHADLADPKSDDPVNRQSTRIACAGARHAGESRSARHCQDRGRGRRKNPAFPKLYGAKREEMDSEACTSWPRTRPRSLTSPRMARRFFSFTRCPINRSPPKRRHSPSRLRLLSERASGQSQCRMRAAFGRRLPRPSERAGERNQEMVEFFLKHFPKE